MSILCWDTHGDKSWVLCYSCLDLVWSYLPKQMRRLPSSRECSDTCRGQNKWLKSQEKQSMFSMGCWMDFYPAVDLLTRTFPPWLSRCWVWTGCRFWVSCSTTRRVSRGWLSIDCACHTDRWTASRTKLWTRHTCRQWATLPTYPTCYTSTYTRTASSTR